VRLRVAVDLLAQLFARVDSFAGRRTGKFFHSTMIAQDNAIWKS
jgi:hypothetical protein